MYVFHVPTSSARSFNSSGLSLTVTSGRPSYFEFSHALAQVSNLKGTLVVNLCEFSQPMHEALPAPLTEVRHDVLNEAVSIFLLVRQQLQRVNQISAKTLRYCTCFEDLGLFFLSPVCTTKSLFGCFQSNFLTNGAPRDPPNVVFQRETVTMRAQV